MQKCTTVLVISVKSLNKNCKKCNKETKHRLVIEKRARSNYYSCSICLENNSKKHRQKKWCAYLAQKANSRKRKDSIKLTEEDIVNLDQKQYHKCALTGALFDTSSKLWKPSLDRIDSNLGYKLNNIRLVAWIVNRSRGNLTDNDFIEMCYKVTEQQNFNIAQCFIEASKKLGW